ncbi:B12-binding domain-containing radical SAM protein [Sphingomonas sp. JC676]|uniref:B12-binding domain-containing radical SAM protein n=1 Tax=Sphingomonas sp. JC676 TaxID=2768065 RepID=UPI0016582583|nr:radical SAM protein [Sphingomonas sp. JC676]MBC9030860.1 B12-binding domain-containing radical SAM protein [Sphingomonas sp. JC676]
MILVAHSFYLRRDRKQFERSKPYAPLATLLAVAILRERGHQVALFDATFEPCTDMFDQCLAELKPAIVLIIEDNFNYLTKMCTEDRRADALHMVAAARSAGARVAVNGPDASDNPRQYLEAGADAVLTGEGELGAKAITEALIGATPLEKTPGLILLDATGQLHYTPPRRQEHALDALPFPAWDLVDVAAYRDTWTQAHGRLSWNMAASRGCPYSCNWCAKPTFGRRYTQRSAASIAEEMARLKRDVAPDHIWFADDIFGMTEDWIAEFAEAVIRRDARIPFMMQSRTNLITERVVTALAAAGAEEVWLGVESGSQRILDAMDKGTQVESVRHATRTLRRHGIRTGWFLQLGYPPEDWEDILLTRDLLRDERPDEIGVSVSYPLPGTVFHDRVVAELGVRRNWRDTDELAMLFQGTFDTAFYRMVRDALHADVGAGMVDELHWHDLARRADAHRSSNPVRMELRA